MSKTIFITGTSSGLGKLTAIYFAKQGWNVAATMRSPKNEKDLIAYSNVKLFELDVTKPESVKSAANDAIAAFGKIDVVLNNAGIGMYGALELSSDSDIDKQYDVNVKGVISVIRTFLPHFRANGSGKFINISSVMGISTALPLGSLYNMSKFALEGLTEGLYFELKPLNIDLHLIEPGGFSSSFGENITFSRSNNIKDYEHITQKVHDTIYASAKDRAPIDPQPIVDTIYALATGKSKAFRTIVGKDAKMLMIVRKVLPIQTFLNFLAGRFLK